MDENIIFSKIRKILKLGNIFYVFVFAFIVFYAYYFLNNPNEPISKSNARSESYTSKLVEIDNSNEENPSLLNKLLGSSKAKNGYSDWPKLINIDELGEDLFNYVSDNCVDELRNLTIESFDLGLSKWASRGDARCIEYYDLFKNIFDVSTKQNRLTINDGLKAKVKGWLGGNDGLVELITHQKLLVVYNKYTYEENVYNSLRNKRPVKLPVNSPSEYYAKTIAESSKDCDFCSENKTAQGIFDKLKTEHSYSAANLFPFDEYHEMFFSRKHDLLEMTYEEFKDFLYLPIEWFSKVQQKDNNYKYPALLWDFLLKSGASQVHPHIHGTVNKDRYYGLFEIIRKGAETYFKQTSRNYFSDYTFLHHTLGLTHIHKNAALIFPLTPKKDYDVTIISEEFNDGVTELLYVLLRTYALDMNVYPFSLTIFYPSLDKNLNDGRIPCYIKVIPRGDISSVRSDTSTLELMTTFNVNLDQFEVTKKMGKLLDEKLSQI